MKKIVNQVLLSLLFLFVFIGAIPTGGAEWNVYYPKETNTDVDVNLSEPVCYYNTYDDSGVVTPHYYRSIELAIDDANEEPVEDSNGNSLNYVVTVIPGSFNETCTITKKDSKWSRSYSYSSVTKKEVTITRSFEINSNVSLVLPYVDESTFETEYVYKDCSPTDEEKISLEDSQYKGQYLYKIVDTADFNSSTTSANLDSTTITSSKTNIYNENLMTLNVKVSDGVKITNKGILRIGGKQSGSSGGNVSGFTTYFAQMTLNGTAKIVNDNKLICLGNIVGSGINSNTYSETSDNVTDILNSSSVTAAIECNSDSSLYIPFVLVEHRGGSNFSSLSSYKDGAPFNRFYFPNILSTVIDLSNVNVYSVADLNATPLWGTRKNQSNRCLIKLISNSNDSLLSSNDYSARVYFQYVTISKNGSTINKPNINLILKAGDFQLNSMTLDIGGLATVSTSQCHFPISCYYSILLSEGKLTSNTQKIKLMPGSYFKIDNNYKATLSDIAVYSDDTTNELTGPGCSTKYEDITQAICLINGDLISTYGGGLFQSSSEGASLYLENLTTNNLKEISSSSSYTSLTLSANGNVKNGESIEIGEVSISNKSIKDGDIYYWKGLKYATSISIICESNSFPAPGGTTELKTQFTPSDADTSNANFTWSYKIDGENLEEPAAYFDTPTQDSTILNLPINKSTIKDAVLTITITMTFYNEDSSTQVTLTDTKEITITKLSYELEDIGVYEDEKCTKTTEPKSSDDAEANYYIKPEITCAALLPNDAIIECAWSVTDLTTGFYFNATGTTTYTTNDLNPVLFHTDKASGSTDIEYTVQLKVTIKVGDDFILNGSSCNKTFKAVTSCLLPNAKIKMANGETKNAENIKPGDKVITFNHEKGTFESSTIIGNGHMEEEANMHVVIKLSFEDGNTTNLIYEHGFFDLTLNKYVYIREDNYQEFIGHDFVEADSSGNKLTTKPVKLINVSVHEEYTKVYSPLTANNLNIVSDNMLSIAGALSGMFNIFEYEENGSLRYAPIKMQADIDKYGLLDYSYFEDLISYEAYEALPCKYLAVSIGKGLITWDEIYEYANRWGSQLVV